MKKNLYLLACLLFVTAYSFAQAFNWEWARSSNGNKPTEQYGQSVACNASAGVYVAGYYNIYAAFGTDTVWADSAANAFSATDYLLARYDSSGRFKWATTSQMWTAGTVARANGVATDSHGNACVAGTFTCDSIYFGTRLVNGIDSAGSVFTAKYDTSGNALWAAVAIGGDALGIATDANDNIYITGYYGTAALGIRDTDLSIGDTVLLDAGGQDIFVAKYNSAGTLQWAQRAGGTQADVANSVASDSLGNVYITGYFYSTQFTIGDTTIAANAAGGNTVFTAKFNTQGKLLWVTTSGGHYKFATGNSVVSDGAQNVYVTGYFAGDTISFGPAALGNYNLFVDSPNFYLVKYNSNGTPQWLKGAGGIQSSGNWVTTDNNNNLYVCGNFGDYYYETRDTFIINTDSIIIPAGAFFYHATMFLIKLDPQGNALNAQGFTDGGYYQNSVCIAPGGAGYLSGTFLEFDTVVFGPDSISSTTDYILFVAKFNPDSLSCNLAPPTINAEITTICANDSALICAPPGYASYLWNTHQTTACFYTSLAGNYYVTVTDGHGCNATSNTVAITVNTPPPVSITVNGDTLTANNGFNFQWYLNGSLLPGDNGNQIIVTKTGQYTVQITDTNGCTTTSNPVNISGINQLSTGAIFIYPNPSIGSWQLTVGNGQLAVSNNLIGASLEVWDNEGQIIYKSKITSVVTEINLPALASGVYYLRVNTGDGVFVRKLLKF
jgi:hypothetical protein